jgi:HAMP domain-containing protein
MLARLNISPRLAVAVAFPLAMLIALAGYDLSVKWVERTEMGRIGPLVDGVAKIGQLVHELQRERGGSSLFISSRGAQMREELQALRKRTDEQRSVAIAALSGLEPMAGNELRAAIARAMAAVRQFDARRTDIDALATTVPSAFAFFTESIVNLLNVTGEIAKTAGHGDLAMGIGSYVSLVTGKEQAGQERARGAAAIAARNLDAAEYGRLLGLKAAQDVFFATFLGSATKEQRDFFARTVAGPAVDNVERMRAAVVKGGLSGDLQGLDGKTWFDATTARIDLIKAVEDRVAADLAAVTAAAYEEANHALTILGAVMMAGVAIGLAVVITMARSITRPLAALRAAMEVLARGDIGLEVPGRDRRDEIGEMAKAVGVFKTNAIERLRLEAEQRDTQARAAAEKGAAEERRIADKQAAAEHEEAARKLAMRKLADEFEAAVGDIVETVSSASTELEAAAASLTKTADATQQLSGAVAAASTDASSNVHSVAAATEEIMSSPDPSGPVRRRARKPRQFWPNRTRGVFTRPRPSASIRTFDVRYDVRMGGPRTHGTGGQIVGREGAEREARQERPRQALRRRRRALAAGDRGQGRHGFQKLDLPIRRRRSPRAQDGAGPPRHREPRRGPRQGPPVPPATPRRHRPDRGEGRPACRRGARRHQGDILQGMRRRLHGRAPARMEERGAFAPVGTLDRDLRDPGARQPARGRHRHRARAQGDRAALER